jgi:hypothetical protein
VEEYLRCQVFHTALEVVCDGLHVLIDDPYGPNIGVQYRLPHSNEYHQVSSAIYGHSIMQAIDMWLFLCHDNLSL